MNWLIDCCGDGDFGTSEIVDDLIVVGMEMIRAGAVQAEEREKGVARRGGGFTNAVRHELGIKESIVMMVEVRVVTSGCLHL